MPSASKKKTTSTARSGKPRPATATATVSARRAPEAEAPGRGQRASGRGRRVGIGESDADRVGAGGDADAGAPEPNPRDRRPFGRRRTARRASSLRRRRAPRGCSRRSKAWCFCGIRRQRRGGGSGGRDGCVFRASSRDEVQGCGGDRRGGRDGRSPIRMWRIVGDRGTRDASRGPARDFEPNPELIRRRRRRRARRDGPSGWEVFAKAELVETAMRVRKELVSRSAEGEPRAGAEAQEGGARGGGCDGR